MYFVPDGTKICGLYECTNCYMRFLSLEMVPKLVCPNCEGELDMELGPDEEMPTEPETAKLIKIVDEDIELIDGLLSLAHNEEDESWL